MRYKTKRLLLEPFMKWDITKEYLKWFSDVSVTEFNSHGLGSYIKEDAEKYLNENKDNIIFAVKLRNNIHIGNISLQSINQLNRSAEFACVFGETKYWGKGYATEALNQLLYHGFQKMNLHRIWTGTAHSNLGMRNVAIKLGMKSEGIFRDGVWLNGKYEDVYSYGILANEWRKNNVAMSKM